MFTYNDTFWESGGSCQTNWCWFLALTDQLCRIDIFGRELQQWSCFIPSSRSMVVLCQVSRVKWISLLPCVGMSNLSMLDMARILPSAQARKRQNYLMSNTFWQTSSKRTIEIGCYPTICFISNQDTLTRTGFSRTTPGGKSFCPLWAFMLHLSKLLFGVYSLLIVMDLIRCRT